MTFSINVPNAAQSPGLFPAQNNTNFLRLRDIINNDHNFTNSAAAAQGIHKQVTLINRSTPVGLTAGNAIVYTKPDIFGATQLWLYNGATNQQLTPHDLLLPIRIVGGQSLGPSATAVILADPGYRYCGTAWGLFQDSTAFSLYNVLRSGGNDIHELDSNGGSVRPVIAFSGNNLVIANPTLATFTVNWSLIINRIS
jgi:hypothetical protein